MVNEWNKLGDQGRGHWKAATLNKKKGSEEMRMWRGKEEIF